MRLECRLKAHSAEKACVDHLIAHLGKGKPQNDEPAELSTQTLRERSRPAPEKTPPRRDNATTEAQAGKGWVMGETTSPVDFSPLLVAKLYALPPVAANAPEILLLRCRKQRTEMSLSVNGAWRASRDGVVEVTISVDEPTTARLRWPLSTDGRTASMPEDATEAVRTLRGGRTSISVTDGAGHNTSSIFDLAGIDAVRSRLASTCHWPNAAAQSGAR